MKNEIIVVTGNIGSGKSHLIKLLQQKTENRIETFSFDQFTQDLYKRQEIIDFLMLMFGTIDRKKISDMVFKAGRQLGKTEIANALLESLNDFFFKFVEGKFVELITAKRPHTLLIEFPLLFEMKQKSSQIDLLRSKFKVITVICDDETRVTRAMQRDAASEAKVRSVIEQQLPQEVKAKLGDYVIDTSDVSTVNAQVDELISTKLKKVFLANVH